MMRRTATKEMQLASAKSGTASEMMRPIDWPAKTPDTEVDDDGVDDGQHEDGDGVGGALGEEVGKHPVRAATSLAQHQAALLWAHKRSTRSVGRRVVSGKEQHKGRHTHTVAAVVCARGVPRVSSGVREMFPQPRAACGSYHPNRNFLIDAGTEFDYIFVRRLDEKREEGEKTTTKNIAVGEGEEQVESRQTMAETCRAEAGGKRSMASASKRARRIETAGLENGTS
eukprot:4082933-Pleurochrysis_carterae.AAC.2